MDLDVDSDYDHSITESDDSLEMSEGGRIPLNDDDDNENQSEDRTEAGPAVEDDLVPIALKIEPADLKDGQAVLSISTNAEDKLAVWLNSDKTGPVILPHAWNVPELPSTLYVEGISTSAVNKDIILTLSYKYSNETICEDPNCLTVVQLDLDIDSDHTTDFGGPECTEEEDKLEMKTPGSAPDQAHKYVVVDNYYEHETDINAVPGYADGYNLDKSFQPDNIMSRSVARPYRPVDNEIFVPSLLKVVPADLPVDWSSVMIKFSYSGFKPDDVSWSGDDGNRIYALPADCGHLRLWRKGQSKSRNMKSAADNGDWVPPEEDIPAHKLDLPRAEGTNLYVEGITNALTELGRERIYVEETGIPLSIAVNLKDWLHCTVIRADVDVDSDNNNGFDIPARNNTEDQFEDMTNRAGKILWVNNGDKDGDSIPDFADGYDLLGDVAEDDINTAEQFVPVVFELPNPIDISRASVKLTYDASDPAGVTCGSDGVYKLPAEGSLRIWRKAGSQARNKESIPSGDYVASGEYSAADFGFSEDARVLTYYLEAVRNSAALADKRILFEVRPDERTGFLAADAVRVTLLKVDLDIDVDDDGDKDDADESAEDSAPGGIVFANWDDDNDNNTCDYDPSESSVSGEDELVSIALKIEPTLNTGRATLEATAGGSRIKIWTSATKTGPVTLPKTWDLATEALPATLYVEAVEKSGAEGDTTLRLKWEQGTTLCQDEITLTCVKINLALASYRSPVQRAGSDWNHADIVTGYGGNGPYGIEADEGTGRRTKAELLKCPNYHIVGMPGEGQGAAASTLQNVITLHIPPGWPGANHEFLVSNPGLANRDDLRLQILANTETVQGTVQDYCWNDAVEGPNNTLWDGDINHIAKLRCDGLVEVVYELAGVQVWGKNGTHYPIQTWPEEHNVIGISPAPDWLTPIVQRGGISGSPTRFTPQPLVEPTTMEPHE